MYSILLPDHLEKNAVKGIEKSYVRKCIIHVDFQICLTSGAKTSTAFYSIRSVNQVLQTVLVRKEALSSYDDKWYLTAHITDIMVYGHWRMCTDAVGKNKTYEQLHEASQLKRLSRSNCG